jgi:glycosyltransferase involved in cell wall biosynthesis
MIPVRNLRFGVILPHTKLFGGVKRFFELGNLLIERGHQFLIFTPEGEHATWFPFKGEILKLEKLHFFAFDALFITEPGHLKDLKKANAKLRIFYAILQKRRYLKRIGADDDLIIFANSTRLYNQLGGIRKKNLLKAIGGIDTEKFQFREKAPKMPGDVLTVLVYGRFYRRKKGTMLVVKACERLYKKGYRLKLLLFDSPVDDQTRKKVSNLTCKLPFQFFVDYPVAKLPELYYKADLFVSAERNAGWSNTSAEAMACGVPVIATQSGTGDFLIDGKTGLVVWRHSWFIQRALKKLYGNENLRRGLALEARKKIEEFSWEQLAENIERFILNKSGS